MNRYMHLLDYKKRIDLDRLVRLFHEAKEGGFLGKVNWSCCDGNRDLRLGNVHFRMPGWGSGDPWVVIDVRISNKDINIYNGSPPSWGWVYSFEHKAVIQVLGYLENLCDKLDAAEQKKLDENIKINNKEIKEYQQEELNKAMLLNDFEINI